MSLPKPISQDEYRHIKLTGIYIEFDAQGGPVRMRMEGGQSKLTGFAFPDGSWLALGDGRMTSTVLVPPPSDSTAEWKRCLDYARADLALTEECFNIRKGRELRQGYDQRYAGSHEWRRVYGDEPGELEEQLVFLAARARECRETIQRLEAAAPAEIVAQREEAARRREQGAESERERERYRARINSISI